MYGHVHTEPLHAGIFRRLRSLVERPSQAIGAPQTNNEITQIYTTLTTYWPK